MKIKNSKTLWLLVLLLVGGIFLMMDSGEEECLQEYQVTESRNIPAGIVMEIEMVENCDPE